MSGPLNPLRLRLLMEMATCLKQITIANGYQHNLVQVFRGRTAFGDDTLPPFVTILERPPEGSDPSPTPKRGPWRSEGWRLLVQGFVADDHTNPTDPAYRLAADVNRRLYQLRREGFATTQGGQNPVTDVYVTRTLVRPPDDTSALAYFWSEVVIDLTENAESPFL